MVLCSYSEMYNDVTVPGCYNTAYYGAHLFLSGCFDGFSIKSTGSTSSYPKVLKCNAGYLVKNGTKMRLDTDPYNYGLSSPVSPRLDGDKYKKSSNYKKLSSIRNPSSVLWMGEIKKRYWFSTTESYFDNTIDWCHNNAANFLFVDGHVQSMKLKDFQVNGTTKYDTPYFNVHN